MKSDQQLGKLRSDAVAIYGSKLYAFIKIHMNNLQLINLILNYSTQKEDEIEEYLRKRYADESIARRHFGDGGEEMSNEITQQTLLPAIK